MKKNKLIMVGTITLVSTILFFCVLNCLIVQQSKDYNIIDLKYTLLKQDPIAKFVGEPITSATFYQALVELEVQHPEVVLAQAQLETAYFTSTLCKEYNNTLGLYDSRSKDFYKFDTWVISIMAYKQLVEYKLKDGEDYYDFLTDLPYAEDPMYLKKIKTLMNRNKKNGLY